MLAGKYLLMLLAVLSITATLIMAGYDLWLVIRFRRNLARVPEDTAVPPGRESGDRVRRAAGPALRRGSKCESQVIIRGKE